MSGAARALRRPAVLPTLPTKWRQRLVALVLGVTLLGAFYILWVRDSSLVQVKEVTISGLTSDDAPRIRAALEAEANEMTTLHLREERLHRAVAGYPEVRGLEVSADFPNGLRVRVLEHHPAAVVGSGRSRVPVAADGSVLRGMPVRGSLPLVEISGALAADRIEEPGSLALVRVAGGAPKVLAGRLEEIVRDEERGIVVLVKDGPELVFGDPTRVRAKWAAATRVLADEGSQGASYVDVRLPGRPAAGGLPVETTEPAEPAISYSQP